MPDDQEQLQPNEQSLLTNLRVLAARGAGATRTSEQWEAWLHRAERFARFGFTNTMLIWAQNPAAVMLNDYAGWQRLQRQVIGGEKGIRLIVTGRDGRERIGSFFDLLQTEGVPVRVPMPRAGADGAVDPVDAWSALADLALREGFRIGRGDDGSVIDWGSRTILIRPDADRLSALAHQVAHVLLHPLSTDAAPVVTAESDCRGLRKVEADSLTFLIARRLGLDVSGIIFPYVTSWAGTDERAQRARIVTATGQRILVGASKALDCLDASPAASSRPVTGPRRAKAGAQRAAVASTSDQKFAPVGERGRFLADLGRAQLEAMRFFLDQVRRSWVPDYLERRGIGATVRRDWCAGYAPGSWTAVTDHLRGLGFSDNVIEASGLATRSSRRTLIDVFRDRAVLPVRDPGGNVLGFIGRARPDAGKDVPKYLNSPETEIYRKGNVLFGLHEGREALTSGARPVIVEGPLDAMTITVAGGGRYVGVAPLGTAFTDRQLGELARVCDLGAVGVIAAFDADEAGLKAAARAYDLLVGVTGRPLTVAFPAGEDPASVFARHGAEALRLVLDNMTRPLADVVIDARIAKFGRSLGDVEGRFNALRMVAPIIARMTPREWPRQAIRVAARLGLSPVEVSDAVLEVMPDVGLDSPARAGPSLESRRVAWRAARDFPVGVPPAGPVDGKGAVSAPVATSMQVRRGGLF